MLSSNVASGEFVRRILKASPLIKPLKSRPIFKRSFWRRSLFVGRDSKGFFVLPWAFFSCFAVSLLVSPWVFGFAVSFMVSPWAFWFCRGEFGFAVSIFVLPWGIWYCLDTFGFTVRYLVLPWQLWATVLGRWSQWWKSKRAFRGLVTG